MPLKPHEARPSFLFLDEMSIISKKGLEFFSAQLYQLLYHSKEKDQGRVLKTCANAHGTIAQLPDMCI